MIIEFHPDHVVKEEEKTALLRVEEIKDKVRAGAKRISFYDDVAGIDSDPEEGSISLNDGNSCMKLNFDPGSQEIVEFSHTRVNKPEVYLKFHRDEDECGKSVEIYESGRLQDGEPVRERVEINKENGMIIYHCES